MSKGKTHSDRRGSESPQKGYMKMERKLRHSHQRDRIFQCVQETKEHPSAEMVYTSLKDEMPGLSLGTVYRNLKLLEELGKVRRVTSYQGVDRYDAICEDHVHFICQGCGCIEDIDAVDRDRLRSVLSLGDGYCCTKLDLIVSGLCPKCSG